MKSNTSKLSNQTGGRAMTDTNQASELYELCKEVYEKTGWIVGDEPWEWYTTTDAKLDSMFIVPKYYTDYLLEKLPQSIDAGRSFAVDMFLVLDRSKSLKYRYRAFYTAPSYGKRHEVVADTPLKALLKLTIALSEAGELK